MEANAALKARAWCSLEAGGELLTAKTMRQAAKRGVAPAFVAKLWLPGDHNPPTAHFRSFALRSPFSLYKKLTKDFVSQS